tara:strand:- start:7 stop:567 length:561 start_codon:yes stop_codon:yes gene_type:complete
MRNGIEKYTDILSKETCQLLVQHIEANIDKALKRDFSEVNNVKCYQLYLEQGSDLDNRVFKGMQTVLKDYCELYPYFHVDNDMGYQLRKVFGETREHVDAVCKEMRNCSIIFGLNDNFENGEFNFPYQQYTTKLGLGEAIIFPVYFMYPHSVENPKGFRYTVNTWTTEETRTAYARPFIPPGTHDD